VGGKEGTKGSRMRNTASALKSYFPPFLTLTALRNVREKVDNEET